MSGRFREFDLHASGSESAAGSGSSVDVLDMTQLVFYFFASSGSGGTLTVMIEDSYDGTNWALVGTFTAVTTSTSVPEAIRPSTGVGRYVRTRWTLTAGSFTFLVRTNARGF